MRDLAIRDLIDMVAAQVSDGEGRIQQMYNWHYDRTMNAVKLVLGSTVSLFVALVLGFFGGGLKAPLWQTGLAAVGICLTAAYGAYRFYDLRGIHREFVSTLYLYKELSRFSSFFARYGGQFRTR